MTGAGAIVTHDVEPYAIVGGVPARTIRYRFSEKIRRKLLEIKWWDWEIEKIEDNIELFYDPEKFLERFSVEEENGKNGGYCQRKNKGENEGMYAKRLKEYVICEEEDLYKAHWMLYKNGSILIVVDADGKYKGVITFRDIKRSYIRV